jgi:hypothetical protein
MERKMELTKREKWALGYILEFDIARYLMANSCQRLDGDEKADRHIRMSKKICWFIFAEKYGIDRKSFAKAYVAMHDFLADILTDRMDEVIGFPINTPLYGSDYNDLKDKFLQVIIDKFKEIEDVAINCL